MIIPNWVTRDPKYKMRLLAEITYIKNNFPNAKIFVENDGEMYVKGFIITTLGGRYDFVMQYPYSYPSVPPETGIIHQKIISEEVPHTYGIMIKGGKKICIFANSGIGSWDPIEYTGLTTIQRASGWCHAYEIWKITKQWPIQSGD